MPGRPMTEEQKLKKRERYTSNSLKLVEEVTPQILFLDTKPFVISQAHQAENTWCMRQLVYIENCMGKSPIVKKLCK